ncbi:hypothetical protein CKF43_09885 [Pantoea graminicola]|nr:hypothetical protein CKF43_09885 [Pantoea sp. ARC607]
MPFLLLTVVTEFCGVSAEKVMEQIAIKAEGLAVNAKMRCAFRLFYLRNSRRMLRILSDNMWT